MKGYNVCKIQGISKGDTTVSCLIWRELSENYQISAQGIRIPKSETWGKSQNKLDPWDCKKSNTTEHTTFFTTLSMALQKFRLEKSLTVSLFSKFLKTHLSLWALNLPWNLHPYYLVVFNLCDLSPILDRYEFRRHIFHLYKFPNLSWYNAQYI